jgi:peptide-methionine (R)-S-oxide reductase
MLIRLLRPSIYLCRPLHNSPSLQLTPHQAYITKGKGLEKPFTGDYWNNHDLGTYHCTACQELLFPSNFKCFTDTGYATFFAAEKDKVKIVESDKKEKEVECAKVRNSQCGSHLGLVFEEKRLPTNLHFQIMSAALKFKPKPWFPVPPSKKQRRLLRTQAKFQTS